MVRGVRLVVLVVGGGGRKGTACTDKKELNSNEGKMGFFMLGVFDVVGMGLC
jgi:hypothetical protein